MVTVNSVPQDVNFIYGGMYSDYCDLFNPIPSKGLKRIYNRNISYRHEDCIASEIKENK